MVASRYNSRPFYAEEREHSSLGRVLKSGLVAGVFTDGCRRPGAAVLLMLSMVFALLFAALIPVSFAASTDVELGTTYGALLWLFGSYLVGPALGWVWFAAPANTPCNA
jgi:hypothetical protein